MSQQYRFTYEAADAAEAKRKAEALNVLATKIPLADLEFIAGKINKNPQAMVDKLHRFRAFI